MRLGVIVIFCLFIMQIQAQSFNYPQLVEKAYSDNRFVPKDWKLLTSTKGDLNRDGIDDLAFVIQYKDSVKLVNTFDDSYDTVTAKPRMLAIAFFDTAVHNYKLVIQNSTFILNNDNPYRDDPFDELSIVNGVLKIDLHFWYSWGTYEMSKISYNFRYQNYTFELIGADNYSLHRATGVTESRSYNFMTGKVKSTKGNMSVDTKSSTWRKFQIGERKNFSTFKAPYTYEVEKDYFI